MYAFIFTNNLNCIKRIISIVYVFPKYMNVCLCFYVHSQNEYAQYTGIYYTQTSFFGCDYHD